tara:strand:- start:276 stop:491 length:216 start_codon:yes stop_codon:yes gene_type:complete
MKLSITPNIGRVLLVRKGKIMTLKITPEKVVKNLVEFLQDEHRYGDEQIEMIVQGDFREALEDKYGEDYDG